MSSGATARPQRDKLIEAAWRREVDLVLVQPLDRWGRSLVDLVNTLQELNALDVGIRVPVGSARHDQPRAAERWTACPAWPTLAQKVDLIERSIRRGQGDVEEGVNE